MASSFLKSLCVSTALLSSVHAVPYSLYRSFSGPTFFDNFYFMTSPDPTHGFVTYVDQATAQGLGYASANAYNAYIGVDHTSVLNPAGPGRRAVRIESKETFTKGLFIGDFNHMPTGCGTWPAFWMYGPNWPYSGEMDILEGVNNQATNQVTAHTSDGCIITGSNSRALFMSSRCYDPVSNSGCSFKARGMYTYGDNFNSVGGGVYAMQWTNDWISVWFFRREIIPDNIKSGTPDPATWGRPMAMFAGDDANIAQRFQNMRIVVNTDFCGDWAGNTFSSMGCGPSCNDYVAYNPGAFANAYWSINSIKVYHPQSNPYGNLRVMPGNATEYASSTTLSFSTATPLARISSVPTPDSGMGATEPVSYGPPPTSTPILVTSLPQPAATAA